MIAPRGVIPRAATTDGARDLRAFRPRPHEHRPNCRYFARRGFSRGHLGPTCVATWLLFGFANLAIYVYAERYTEWQAIVGMLVTAVLDFVIVGLALVRYRSPKISGAAPVAPREVVRALVAPGPQRAV